MSSAQRLNITTIYSGQGKRRRVARGGPSGRVLALLSLVVAAAWLYVALYPVDRYFTRQFAQVFLSQPITIDWSAILPPPPDSVADPGRPLARRPAKQPERPTAAETAAAFAESEAVMTKLTIVVYSWVAVTMFVTAWMAMCAGSGFSSRPRSRAPLLAIAGVVCGIVAAGAVIVMWLKHSQGAGKPPAYAEMVLAGAVALAGGLFVAGTRRAATRAAAVLLLCGLLGLATWCEFRHGWPTIAYRTCMLLIFLAAIVLGAFTARASRTGIGICVAVAFAALAALVIYTWQQRESLSMEVLTRRYAVLLFALGLAVVLVLALIAKRPSAMHSVAVVLILLASGASLAGMWYANKNGWFLGEPPQPLTYVKVFAVQSSYAWVILLAKLGNRWF